MKKFLVLAMSLILSAEFNFSFHYYWLYLRSKFSEGNYLSYMKLCISKVTDSKNRLFYVKIMF